MWSKRLQEFLNEYFKRDSGRWRDIKWSSVLSTTQSVMLPEAQHWGLIKSKLRPSPAEGMGSTGQVLCAGESWRRERGGNRGAGLEKKVWAGTAIWACRLSHVSGDQRVCVCVFACVNGLVSTIWSFLVMRKHTARNERLPSTSSISGRRPFSPCLVGVEQEVVGDLGVCVCVCAAAGVDSQIKYEQVQTSKSMDIFSQSGDYLRGKTSPKSVFMPFSCITSEVSGEISRSELLNEQLCWMQKCFFFARWAPLVLRRDSSVM